EVGWARPLVLAAGTGSRSREEPCPLLVFGRILILIVLLISCIHSCPAYCSYCCSASRSGAPRLQARARLRAREKSYLSAPRSIIIFGWSSRRGCASSVLMMRRKAGCPWKTL